MFLREEVLAGAYLVIYCWHSMRGFDDNAKAGYKAMLKHYEYEN